LTAEYRRIDRSPGALRRFAWVVGSVLGLLGGFLIYRDQFIGWPLGAGAFLLIACGLVAPQKLTAFHRVWMTASLGMGWVMTQLLLTVTFVVALLPVGLLQRAFGKRSLDLRFRSAENSYWKARTESDESVNYEQQF
jgi:hypothetical protein